MRPTVKRSATILLGALLIPIVFAQRPASAADESNRIALNRIAFNRIAFNRIAFNRIAFNRIAFNRIALNAVSANHLAAADEPKNENATAPSEGFDPGSSFGLDAPGLTVRDGQLFKK